MKTHGGPWEASEEEKKKIHFLSLISMIFSLVCMTEEQVGKKALPG